MKHEIMQAMLVLERGRELDGRVEMDDAFLGGQRSGGKTGCGSENKVPFVAAVQTTPDRHPLLACLRQQPHTSEQVAVFAAEHLATSARVVSDGLSCFRATTIVGAEHEPVVTRGGEASVARPELRAVNTLLGNLKTAIEETHHAFEFAKYAHRYLAEFQYRFKMTYDASPSGAMVMIVSPATQTATCAFKRQKSERRFTICALSSRFGAAVLPRDNGPLCQTIRTSFARDGGRTARRSPGCGTQGTARALPSTRSGSGANGSGLSSAFRPHGQRGLRVVTI